MSSDPFEENVFALFFFKWASHTQTCYFMLLFTCPSFLPLILIQWARIASPLVHNSTSTCPERQGKHIYTFWLNLTEALTGIFPIAPQ